MPKCRLSALMHECVNHQEMHNKQTVGRRKRTECVNFTGRRIKLRVK